MQSVLLIQTTRQALGKLAASSGCAYVFLALWHPYIYYLSGNAAVCVHKSKQLINWINF